MKELTWPGNWVEPGSALGASKSPRVDSYRLPSGSVSRLLDLRSSLRESLSFLLELVAVDRSALRDRRLRDSLVSTLESRLCRRRFPSLSSFRSSSRFLREEEPSVLDRLGASKARSSSTPLSRSSPREEDLVLLELFFLRSVSSPLARSESLLRRLLLLFTETASASCPRDEVLSLDLPPDSQLGILRTSLRTPRGPVEMKECV